MDLRISLDAMGGDFGPAVTVPAAIESLSANSKLHISLVGDKSILESALSTQPTFDESRLSVIHASQIVEMHESPALALRGKKDSSMRVAINLVKDGEANACVSAGNTGALMATSKFVLKTLPGVDRPAIISAMPTIAGHTHMLDLGANIESSADQLFQFAVMGSILTQAVDSIERPTIGLLNVGEEEMKGNEKVKQAAQMLANSHLNYYGFIEGDDIFKGTVDVVVCDGFVGNIALKTSEGVAKMISHFMKEQFTSNVFRKLAALLSVPALKSLKKRTDPRRYNGASLVGLTGIVIKSHGGADVFSLKNAIQEAVVEISKDVPVKIGEQLAEVLVTRQAI